MQYQTFPGVKGGSQSLPKLVALRLPALKGKRFLDVGCNEGYFCGYALHDGAEAVVGLDKSAAAIQKARYRFPEGQFHQQSWDTLPDGPFDVITLLSALHYAQDQEALVHRLMSLLSEDGLLVLEISIAPEGGDKWVKVQRSIDERYFPTRQKLGTVLQDYAWKVIGHSVNQEGDPLQRYVVHVRKMRPYAYLMMEAPGSGKSTISRRLFKQAKIPVVGGDRVYLQVSEGKHQASDALRDAISEGFTTASIDKVTERVFASGLEDELVGLWISQAGKKGDFAIDSFVPPKYQDAVRTALFNNGYFPVDLNWSTDPDLRAPRSDHKKAQAYEDYLVEQARVHTRPGLKVRSLLAEEDKPLVRWHLDAPVNGQILTDDETTSLAGWVVTSGRYQKPLQLYVKQGGEQQVFDFTRPRKDVLKALYGSEEKAPEFWRDRPSGFMVNLPTGAVERGCEIGVLVEGVAVPLATLAADNSGSPVPVGKKLMSRLRRLKS